MKTLKFKYIKGNNERLGRLIVKSLLLSVIFSACSLSGCKKLVEAPAPVTSINSGNVYATDATAIGAITDIYFQMSSGAISANQFSLCSGLSADEYTLYSGVQNTIYNFLYTNTLSVSNFGATIWGAVYNNLFTVNSAIEGLNASKTLTPAVKQQLLGEAYFLRGFFYFYLTNYFGDVPLALTSNYTVNQSLARTSQATVYQQVISDLQTAQGLLSKKFLDGTLLTTTTSRLRPTYWAATALLARTYLYTKDWTNAYAQSSLLISNNAPFTLALLPNLNVAGSGVFAANSNEAIWQLQPVVSNLYTNTLDGRTFILPTTGPSTGWPYYLSPVLLNSFELGDQRRVNWVSSVTTSGVTYYYPYKYKIGSGTQSVSEYTMVFRLAEQYLIRAEAQANGAGSNIPGAIADLNVIRTRAGLPGTTATTQSTLSAAILHEREVELFTEWGHRWLDLKRTGNIDVVMMMVVPLKAPGTQWQSFQQLYPVPLQSLNADPFLSQNTGY